MVERLVDLVDQEDSEHDFLQLEQETACPVAFFEFLSPRVHAIESLSVVDSLWYLPGQELGISQFDARPNQLQGMEFETPVSSLDIDSRADVFSTAVRPQTSIEDITIFENVPGI